MNCQKSILSFLKKPLPIKDHNIQTSNPSNQSHADLNIEIQGTDTPPEKVPHQFFSRSFHDEGSRVFPPSDIMRKFANVDELKNSTRGHERHGFSKFLSAEEFPQERSSSQYPQMEGIRPFVPRLKRVQEEYVNFEDENNSSMQKISKRLKFSKNIINVKESQEVEINAVCKFEWLQPSQIKDANGRSPGDALYDKRTLYIPPDALKKMTPSQRQYWNVKCQYMDIVLFFKVGKFYELYELDAEIGHKELDWKMTLSGVGKCRQVGVSENGIDDSVQKLIALGYKVGRMEQLETSDQAKSRGANSVIQRKLIHVTTPSTTMDNSIGPDAVHLLTIKEDIRGIENDVVYGFAFVDCAALKFWIGSINDDSSCASLGALLMQVSPREVIHENPGLSNQAQKTLEKYSITGSKAIQITPVLPGIDFLDASKVENLIQLKGYFVGFSDSWDHALNSIADRDLALCALGGLISHLSRLMQVELLRNGNIIPYEVYKGYLKMDGQTLVNLEIFNNNSDAGLSGTLFKYLNNCITSSGKRILRNWICHPLKDVHEINNRLNVVESLMENSEIIILVAQYLQKLPDLERLLGRVRVCTQSSVPLLLSLIGKKIFKQRVKVFGSLVKGLRVGITLLILLEKDNVFSSLVNVVNLPVLSGRNALDGFLAQFEAAVDSDFPNYQDHEVTEMDEVDAETLSCLIELFVERCTQWSQVINAISYIDVLRSFAITAQCSCGPMSRPCILPQSGDATEGSIVKIKGLWHPFALGDSGMPVPNDIHLGQDSNGYYPRTLLLTGPNMGGKSTLLRATCLAVILAQLGCYVPCEMCVLSLVDIIFTRLGATDRIMTGESTFLVECAETASILQNVTKDSLVILDELGRGTSTFDGYAIAYAVFRHLVENVNCRLLFATHYHPLTKEFGCHPHVTLQHMACTLKSKSGWSSEVDSDLVFLYRLAMGACPESYGLQVALMAGIPKGVVQAASKAFVVMKVSIGESFKISEQRSEFSTLHENWVKALIALANIEECDFDDDAFDTLFCLWHELKVSYRSP